MAAVATERWSESELTFAVELSQWRAVRAFDVIGAASKADAIRTVIQQFGVLRNAPHPENGLLRVQQQNAATPMGPTVWRVRINYAVPAGGDMTANDNPLLLPPLIRWSPSIDSEPFEVDPYGNPFVNSAGDPYDPSPLRDVACWTLTVTRNQPFFAPAQYGKYLEAINSDQFTIRGAGQNTAIEPGSMRCVSIAPTGEYTNTAKFVPVSFQFKVRPNNTQITKQAHDAWDIRLADKGLNGWYKDSNGNQQKGRFFRGPVEVTDPVLLDGTGKPADTAITVTKLNYAPIANPEKLPQKVRTEKQNVGGLNVTYLHYDRDKTLPFAGLL